MNNLVSKHLQTVVEGFSLLDMEEIEKAIRVLEMVRSQSGTVYLFGNGGSHATATHFANDLIKMCRMKAMCIGDMTSAMLAYGNDDGWENMFSHPLKGFIGAFDAALGISCSGNSSNVINGLLCAKSKNAFTIGLTGGSLTSELGQMELDAKIRAMLVSQLVPAEIQVQEDIHLAVCHAMARVLAEKLS